MAQELKDYDIMDVEAMDDARLEESPSGRISASRVYLKDEVDTVLATKDAEIFRLKARVEELESFCTALVKDCKWLSTDVEPTIQFFETCVICTNGKKRVAQFRKYDRCWYDSNNGYKLKVLRWLWQPDMPNKATAAQEDMDG